MSSSINHKAVVNLSSSLHDGIVEGISFDPQARSLAIVVDVPYLWSFHKLTSESRYRIVLEGVRRMTAFNYVLCPAPVDVPSSNSEDWQREHYEMGHLESVVWQGFIDRVDRSEDYDILRAEMLPSDESRTTLCMTLANNVEFIYPELEITADCLRFYLGSDRELTADEFLAMGRAYWDDFSQRHNQAHSHNESQH